MRLVDMLVALSISEDAIYPLIQSQVWAKIGGEPRLLKRVLDSFIRVGQYLFIVSHMYRTLLLLVKYTHTDMHDFKFHVYFTCAAWKNTCGCICVVVCFHKSCNKTVALCVMHTQLNIWSVQVSVHWHIICYLQGRLVYTFLH